MGTAGLLGPWAPIGALASALVWAVSRRPRMAAASALVALAALAGLFGADRRRATLEAVIPTGDHTVAGRVLSDPATAPGSFRFLLRPSHLADGSEWRPWDGPRVEVVVGEKPAAVAGDLVAVTGTFRHHPGFRRGDPVAGTVVAVGVDGIEPAADPAFRIGNWLRRRVQVGLVDYRGAAPAVLLQGFLIGDVEDLPDRATEALRRSGLSHFVAVSGSNVALFLTAWWLAMGPLAFGARRRALVGLAGLVVFVVATRWEPSVVRAALMAGLVLGGRLIGVPVDAWTALGGAVTLSLLVSPELGSDVGFQLSVAATAGVLAGARLAGRRRPRWAWTAMTATLSAQAAVAPLLLLHFGAVPLLAPVANVAAAPVVVLSTSAGGLGVITGLDVLTATGVGLASVVLGIARVAGDWPQLGWSGAAALAAGGAAALRRGLRPIMALAAAALIVAVVAMPAGPPGGPRAIFLDVGQGDAALLQGPDGETVLIDGGPDAAVLREALRRHGVRRVDLMVASHGHADHVTGLLGAIEAVPVGRLWTPRPAPGELLDELAALAAERDIAVESPAVGWAARVGAFHLEVLGPLRRYASPNDESLVLVARAAGGAVLFAGDIEAIAQRELGPIEASVLKVPHQGGATSDPEWLEANAGEVAVISVGPNSFGHPAPEVMGILEEAGAAVRRTDLEGDVVVSLDGG